MTSGKWETHPGGLRSRWWEDLEPVDPTLGFRPPFCLEFLEVGAWQEELTTWDFKELLAAASLKAELYSEKRIQVTDMDCKTL